MLDRYQGRSLRFVTASGSRMQPRVVTEFMDRFGDVIYNNYNATEAGMIATATPADLRAAPDTAGKPADSTEIRILDEHFSELPRGEVGGIYVRSGRFSTATPPVPTRTSTTASWRRATSAISTPRAGCSWWAVTTR